MKSKGRSKEIISLIFTALLFLIFIVFASAADPGHSVSALSAGTFPAGNYAFLNNVTVNEKVGIGISNPAEKLEVAGAIKLNDTVSSCDEIHRGVMKFVPINLAEDKLYQCMRNSTNDYIWVQIATSG